MPSIRQLIIAWRWRVLAAILPWDDIEASAPVASGFPMSEFPIPKGAGICAIVGAALAAALYLSLVFSLVLMVHP